MVNDPLVSGATRATGSLTGSPQLHARIGGILYLLIIAAGLFAEVAVRARVIVAGDAAATARNITTHALLFRAISRTASCCSSLRDWRRCCSRQSCCRPWLVSYRLPYG